MSERSIIEQAVADILLLAGGMTIELADGLAEQVVDELKRRRVQLVEAIASVIADETGKAVQAAWVDGWSAKVARAVVARINGED
uniref:Uncharacterized protein n=1 Tax=viral metagenome TaxID=1070528 RepID=A0A6M3LV78_9ZZZZ